MTKFILDTDHISLHQHGHPLISQRLLLWPANQITVTIISFAEQVRGRLAIINRASDEVALTQAFKRLHETLVYFSHVKIVDFDQASATQFHLLRQQRISIGTQDLRIAAIALSTKAILVTRNQRDFEKVPGLITEDWSVPKL